MNDYDYDLFVIGGGSGGVRAARVAAQLGARVAVCEQSRLGGTCVNVGCVPKKLFVYGSHFAYDWKDAEGFGWSGEMRFDWARLLQNKDREILRLNQAYQSVLQNAGVQIFHGKASLSGPHSVRIGKTEHSSERILIATGGRPRKPDIEGAELALYSDDVFSLATLPARMLIVGGGYVAVEFASVFEALGVQVIMVHRGDEILRGFDKDLRCHLHRELERKGIEIRLQTEVDALHGDGDSTRVVLNDGSQLTVDFPLFAIGREPNTDGLGLDALGVERTPRGGIVVGEDYETTVPSIYAVGDVIDHIQLTPVAIAEGMHFAHRFYGRDDHRIDYRAVPTAIFSQPEFAAVGLTEEQAWHRCQDVRVFESEFTPLKLSLSERKERTSMKLVVDAQTDRVVGCHMIGSGAAEIIQGLAVAMKSGATKADFDATIGIHPTSAEEFVTLWTPKG